MQFKKFYTLIYFAIISFSVSSQAPEYVPSFNSPVKYPIYLSGNFGELRSNHFHTGIDIKTGGVIGKHIHTIDKGYISRIKVSGSGYGKTLYIAHPNGFTSVYAHLDRFNKKIGEYVKKYQYENEEFAVNIFPEKDELTVEKGQFIAYSGNSGSSKGPHLHFEIRKTANQHPVNPLFYNFPVKDKIAPKLFNLAIYPISKYSAVNGIHDKLILPLEQNNNQYILKDSSDLLLSGKIGFSIETYDFLNGSRNWCGVYSIELKINDTTYYLHELNELDFNTNRYINAHIDYEEKDKNRKSFQKLFLSPNNQLKIYRNIWQQGLAKFQHGHKYKIEIIIRDVYANKSQLTFFASGEDAPNIDMVKPLVKSSNLFAWENDNVFETDSVYVKIPRRALYDTLLFEYKKDKSDKYYSDIHHIHNTGVALQKSFNLSIKPTNLDSILYDKLVVALIDKKDGELESWDGVPEDGLITTKVNKFGSFVLALDTVAPKIRPLFKSTEKIKNKIAFKVSDDLSGIKDIKGYVDNNWALFEYDPKNNLIFYIFDGERIVKGQDHEIELYITDYKENIGSYYNTVYW